MKSYDLYGFQELDIESARRAVEKALGIVLNAHESSYQGGDYYRLKRADEEEFILKNNYDSFEQEWFEEDFQERAVLLYVDATEHADEIKKKLVDSIKDISLLRRENL